MGCPKLIRSGCMSVLACSLALSAPTSTLAQAIVGSPGTPVILPSTFEHRFVSKVTGREYILWVVLPPSYGNPSMEATTYRTLYILDGRQGVQLSAPMLQLTNRGQSGDLILVGIGYPLDSRGLPSCGEVLCRDVDYTVPAFPASDSVGQMSQKRLPQSGGAPSFLRVLKEEVIPLVESQYRTTTDRGLLGYSFGGLFAMYALIEDPEVFSRYAAVSPALYWNIEMMLRREVALRPRAATLMKTVYLSVGSQEAPYAIADTWRLIAALCDGLFTGTAYKGLDLLVAINADEGHSSPVHFARALSALYPARDTAEGLPPPIRRLTATCTPG